MSQFDVFENPDTRSRANVPFVVIVQSDHFVNAKTAVVTPLVRLASKKVSAAINPSFEIEGEKLTLEPLQVAFIPRRELTRKVGSLAEDRHTIIAAIDAMLSGL